MMDSRRRAAGGPRMSDDRIHDEIRDEVRAYYLRAARGGRDRAVDVVGDERWGTGLYDTASLAEVPQAAADLSMGCGNPYLLADLADGDVVLDLGSGGGIDVILSAKRVAPNGKAYGLDMLAEMVEIATRNAVEAGVTNVEFRQGLMEQVPLPDASVDVVISNCVISLAPDKTPVFAEMSRVLRPGGRVAVSDVVAEPGAVLEATGEEWVACGAGALGTDEYVAMLEAAGLADVTIEITHEVGERIHAAMIRARKPS